ncbi:putative oxidoreductase C-terminal domain-containing protein [Pseudopedobacter beijingensis]|uniref:Oxidoreductase C-terminal domain-containing protein n=1 Tax=Pseudopedobacter beijingensis TaxID=1207056 RepID=A0ABW4IJE7_9SPHI
MKKNNSLIAGLIIMIFTMSNCSNSKKEQEVKLITLNPGHFHAALVQKSMYEGVSPEVYVYAPEGEELEAHLKLVEKYNTREEDPTQWKENVYKGSDFLEKMLSEKKGNLVVLAGNNKEKTSYIEQSVKAGFNVLADKPMAIDANGFSLLQKAFEEAKKNNVLLYDIMTERYEITNTLQKELFMMGNVFGELEKGTPENPAIVKESIHHFFKNVSGSPLIRPSWYYDVNQLGDGLVDVTTHLVDLIQWTCFPDQILDYHKDINMNDAKRWATLITPSQFKKSTNKDTYPDFLKKDLKDSVLSVYSNGEMNYTIKGVTAKVSVIWNYQAPEGTGDTHFSEIKGTKASLKIKQGKEQGFKPVLYIEPKQHNDLDYKRALFDGFVKLQKKYPGIELKEVTNGYEVIIPESYKVGHEAHFAEVARKYLAYLKEGKLPEWEVPNMIAKYYTTTSALELAKKGAK